LVTPLGDWKVTAYGVRLLSPIDSCHRVKTGVVVLVVFDHGHGEPIPLCQRWRHLAGRLTSLVCGGVWMRRDSKMIPMSQGVDQTMWFL
jgi:hypothetical protein